MAGELNCFVSQLRIYYMCLSYIICVYLICPLPWTLMSILQVYVQSQRSMWRVRWSCDLWGYRFYPRASVAFWLLKPNLLKQHATYLCLGVAVEQWWCTGLQVNRSTIDPASGAWFRITFILISPGYPRPSIALHCEFMALNNSHSFSCPVFDLAVTTPGIQKQWCI